MGEQTIQSSGEATESAYDVVVIGAGMGGLTSGALLALAGKKVLVVEEQERPGGHAHAICKDGYTFDSAVHLITQCRPRDRFGVGVVDALLRHLGVHDRCELMPVGDPFYTVHFPDFVLAVPTGRDAYLSAHLRHFPHEARGLRRLVDLSAQIAGELRTFPEQPGIGDLLRMPWRYPALLRYRNSTMQQLIDRELHDPRLKSAYATLWSWIGSPPSRASFAAWADMMANYIEGGAYYCRGGFQSLADAVATALVRAGGELVLGRRVARILALRENR
jgi:prolycopene isomerase